MANNVIQQIPVLADNFHCYISISGVEIKGRLYQIRIYSEEQLNLLPFTKEDIQEITDIAKHFLINEIPETSDISKSTVNAISPDGTRFFEAKLHKNWG